MDKEKQEKQRIKEYIFETCESVCKKYNVNRLARSGNVDEIKSIDFPKPPKKVLAYLARGEFLQLEDKEIPIGCVFTIVLWLIKLGMPIMDTHLFDTPKVTLERIIPEAGDVGRRILLYVDEGWQLYQIDFLK